VLLVAGEDVGKSSGYLARYKYLAPAGAFVVEENAVAGKHPVRLTVVYRHPVPQSGISLFIYIKFVLNNHKALQSHTGFAAGRAWSRSPEPRDFTLFPDSYRGKFVFNAAPVPSRIARMKMPGKILSFPIFGISFYYEINLYSKCRCGVWPRECASCRVR